MPQHGVFVETRLRQLLKRAPQVQARVVAPVPWFPSAHPRFGGYSRMAAIPRNESLHGISVSHPRFFVIPNVSWRATPLAMAAQSYPTLRRLIEEGYDFDLIDSHYLFPDGVAAAFLARKFAKPFFMTARGSDVRVLTKYALPRAQILWAARRAAKVITVCAALAQELKHVGLAPEHVAVLRNGVDLSLFAPGDRIAARRELGIAAPGVVLASVGLLITRKRHDIVIRALASMPEAMLLIAGAGGERKRLESIARDSGVSARVRFLGEVSQARLVTVYRSADALVLASHHEGWPNVLLEAMACGCPAVANNFDGVREVIQTPHAGLVMHEHSPEGVVAAVQQLLARYPGAAATRRYAENFDWNATSDGQVELFTRALLANREGAPMLDSTAARRGSRSAER